MSSLWLKVETVDELLDMNEEFLTGQLDSSPFYGPVDEAVENLSFLIDMYIIPMNGQDPNPDRRSYMNGMIRRTNYLYALYHFLRFHKDKFYCFISNDTLNTFPTFPFAESRSKNINGNWVESDYMEEPSGWMIEWTFVDYPNLISILREEFIYFHISACNYNDGSVLELLKEFGKYYHSSRKSLRGKTISTLIDQYDYVPVNDIWGSIRTYQNLIEVNTAFIEGKLFQSPYHYGPVTTDWSNTGDSSLAQLNRFGFITINGQPYLHKVESFLDKDKVEIFMETIQTPYLVGFLPVQAYPFFVEFMKTQPYFYYYAKSTGKNPQTLQNTYPDPSSKYTVTRTRDSKQRSDLDRVEWDNYTNTNYQGGYIAVDDFEPHHNIISLLKGNTVEIELSSDYEHHLSIVDMMISFFKTLPSTR
jgi:hypothetical protein